MHKETTYLLGMQMATLPQSLLPLQMAMGLPPWCECASSNPLASTPTPRTGPRAARGRRATTCEQQMSSHSARPRQAVGEICLYLKGSHLLSTAESLATAVKTVSLPTSPGSCRNSTMFASQPNGVSRCSLLGPKTKEEVAPAENL